ncbi:MAG: FHA domain-containing protein [Melioribacteraceae bacterium]
MTIKFTITRLKDSSFNKELSFQKFPISIGRDSKNDITLEDKSKVISRIHAKIFENNGSVKLFDLGSRNSTLLNNEKIKPQIEYDISEADSFTIGDYKFALLIQFEREADIIDNDRTMIFKSPFADEVKDLANCLKKLSEKYSKNEDQMRDEYLRMDFLTSLSEQNFSNISHFVAEHFGGKYSAQKEENTWGEISGSRINYSEKKSVIPEIKNEPVLQNTGNNYSFNSHFTNSFDILLESVTKLIQGFWHFRQEFFGVTIYQTIPISSVEKLKEFLFDLSISDEESNKRIELFRDELNKIFSHQVGLLDGYKESVNNGIENILKEVNPSVLENIINSEKFKIGSISLPYKYIPFYARIKSIQIARSMHKKIRLDMNVFEKKYFRPAFIKGYQKRIT